MTASCQLYFTAIAITIGITPHTLLAVQEDTPSQSLRAGAARYGFTVRYHAFHKTPRSNIQKYTNGTKSRCSDKRDEHWYFPASDGRGAEMRDARYEA